MIVMNCVLKLNYKDNVFVSIEIDNDSICVCFL